MRNKFEDAIGITDYREVESPRAVGARLPDILGFVVFLCMKRRMSEIITQQSRLFEERASNGFWRSAQRFGNRHTVLDPHRRGLAVFLVAGFLNSFFK